MKTEIGKYIGLATLVGVSLTCDSNKTTFSSVIENQKSDIENILATPVDTHSSLGGITRKIGYTISQHTTDTLTLGDSSSQDIAPTDTMQIATIHSINNTTDATQRGPNNNTIITDTPSKENIKKVLSEQECDNLLDKQITQAIVEIVPETEKIKFNLSYMRGEAYNLFTHFFTIEDTEDGTHLIFSKIQKNDKILVTQHMDNMKHHIKEKNGFWIKLLLTKGDLKDYIMKGDKNNEKGKTDQKTNIEKLYEIITNTGSIKYEGGQSQFKKDVESVINLY